MALVYVFDTQQHTYNYTNKKRSKKVLFFSLCLITNKKSHSQNKFFFFSNRPFFAISIFSGSVCVVHHLKSNFPSSLDNSFSVFQFLIFLDKNWIPKKARNKQKMIHKKKETLNEQHKRRVFKNTTTII